PTPQLLERFGDAEQEGFDRTPAWRQTVDLIRDYPVSGSGLGTYESAFLKYKHSAVNHVQDYAHNDYLQFFSELGLVGFILLAIPCLSVCSRLLNSLHSLDPRVRWLSLACTTSLLAISLHSFVDFNLYVPANMLTVAWILGLSKSLG